MTDFYSRTDSGAIQHQVPMPDTPYRFILQAANVREERTGVHAKVTIALGTRTAQRLVTTVLAEDTFNVGRSEDRIKLTNHALKEPLLQQSPDIKAVAAYMASILQHEMLTFCRDLWEFEMSAPIVAERGGSTTRVEPEYLLEPYVLAKAGTIGFAGPGAGKSWTALLFAVLIDAGISWPWPVRQPAKVLVVNLERSAESVDHRLGSINEAVGLPRERPLARIDKRGATLLSIYPRLERYVRTQGIDLIILDSLSRAGVGNMNDNQPMNAAMDMLNALGCGWFVLGHTAREDATHLFGSQMQDAAADLMVRFISQRSQIRSPDGSIHPTLGVGVVGVKANDIELPPLTVTRFEFTREGLVAVQKAEPGEFLDIETTARGDDPTEALRKYLLGVGAADITTIARDIGVGKRKVASYLARRAEFRIVRTDDEGRAFYGVQELHVSPDEPPPPEYTPEDTEPPQFDMDEYLEAIS